MGSLVVRNLSDDVHRALKVRAKQNNMSTEAEIRKILTMAVMSNKRIKLGSLLTSFAKEAGYMTDDEVENMCFRDKSFTNKVDFE